MKRGFTPIKLDEFVRLHLKSNPEIEREEIVGGLTDAREAYKQGVRCNCGEPIWVIGSAFAGNACFTCITGESMHCDDYEIEEACR